MNQLYSHLYVVARHAHLSSSRKLAYAGNVSCSEVELRTIVVEERCVTAALVLGQNVYLSGKLVVALNRAGLAQTLSSLDLSSLNTTQKCADVVAGLSLIKKLTEHLDTGNNGLAYILMDTDDLNLIVQMQSTALYSTGSNRTTAGNGEHVLNRHKEGLVSLTYGIRNPLVNSIHELKDLVAPLAGGILKSLQSGTLDNGSVIARELVLVQQVSDLHLNQLKKLGIVTPPYLPPHISS